MSRRHRWAAVASAISLVAGYGVLGTHNAQAASSEVQSDPGGDANTRVTEGGTTTVPNQPKVDVLSASVAYEAGSVVLSVKTAQPVNPATDPGWGDSGVTWSIDTTGDKNWDYQVDFGVDGGNLYADVFKRPNTDTATCSGQPSVGPDGSYVVSVSPTCFGSPASFNWGGLMEFMAEGATEAVVDRFPNGEGNYFGPVQKPGTTPTPTTPTTRPGTDPAPTTTTTAPRPIVTAPVSSNEGFWLLGRDGGVFSFGSAQFYGSIGHLAGAKQISSMAADPDGTGYWFVGADGGIYAYKAPFWGAVNTIKLTKPIVGMAATTSGKGYWLVASDGGMFAFGDAGFYGSTGAIALNKPIVGMAPTPSGKGYWLVASDGGIFAFGDAPFYGSTGDIALNEPIVGMGASSTGKGYWFVARDGGVFAFGDAPFLGSAVNGSSVPVVGMSGARKGLGYRVARADGTVTAYGSAAVGGGLTGSLSAPIVGIVNAY